MEHFPGERHNGRSALKFRKGFPYSSPVEFERFRPLVLNFSKFFDFVILQMKQVI